MRNKLIFVLLLFVLSFNFTYADEIKASVENGKIKNKHASKLDKLKQKDIDPILIDKYTNEATFVLSWSTPDGSSSKINFSLVDPDGITIDVNNAEDVRKGSTYTMFRILAPKRGTWSAVTKPAPGIPKTYYEVQVFANSPSLKFEAYLERTKYGICEPVILHAEAKLSGTPITRANVTSNIKKPDGNYLDPVTLYDDGNAEHGDKTANDGIYSVKLSGYKDEGPYTFEITVIGADFTREAIATTIIRQVNIRTAASISGEHYINSEGQDFINKNCTITLSVIYSDVSIGWTEYAIDKQRDFNFGTNFNLAGYTDGEHIMYYSSSDKYSRSETLKSKKIYLDNLGPITTIKQIVPLLTLDTISDLTSYNAVLNNVRVVSSIGNGEVLLSPASPPYITSGSIQHIFQVANTTIAPVLKTEDSTKLQIDTLVPTSIYGTPLFVPGKIKQAVYLRQGATNILIANQSSIETDLSGLIGNTKTEQISRIISDSYYGNASIKCITNGSSQFQGYQVDGIPVIPGRQYTFSVYLKLISFDAEAVGINLQMRDGSAMPIANKDIFVSELSTVEWKRFEISATFTQTKASVLISTAKLNPENVGIIWLADGMQFEELSYATDWISGGTTRQGEMLRYENVKMGTEEGSVSFWFKLKGKGGTNNCERTALVLKNNTDGNWKNSIHIGYEGNEKNKTFKITIFDSSGEAKTVKNPERYSISTEKWYHYTATWEHGKIKIYFNGEYLGDGYKNGTGILSRAPNVIGVGGVEIPSNTLFNGCIDDLRIYDVILSDVEVRKIYERKLSALSNETVLALGFDDNSLDGRTTTKAKTKIKYEVSGGNSQVEAESAPLKKVMVSVSSIGSGFGLLNKVGSYPWYRVKSTLTTEDSNQTPVVNRLTIGNLESIKPLSSYIPYLDVTFETQDSNKISSGPKSLFIKVNNEMFQEFCFAYAPTVTINYGKIIQYYSVDNLNNNEHINVYTYISDSTAPSTTINIDGPKYANYVKSSSRFTLKAKDSSSGVDRSEYSIDMPDNWSQYPQEGFYISKEGSHTIYYRSIDRVGNIEQTKQISVIVDNSSPVTNLLKVNRKELKSKSDWQSAEQSIDTDLNSSVDNVLINMASKIKTASPIIYKSKAIQINILDFKEDPIGTGKFIALDMIHLGTSINYSIAYSDIGTSWTVFQPVVDGSTVENHRFIKIKAVLNSNSSNNLSPVLKKMGVEYVLPGYLYDYRIYVNQHYKLILSSKDPDTEKNAGSGIKNTFYKIDNGDWKTYNNGELITMPDTLFHYLYFYSINNLGVQESNKIVGVIWDVVPPNSNIAVSNPKNGNNPVVVNLVSEFSLSAVDPVSGTAVSSGIDKIEYKIDKGLWTEYFVPFTIQEGNNPQFISYRSIDRAGNVEAKKNLRISLDAYAPESGVISPTDGSYHRTNSSLREMKGYARDNFEVDNVSLYIRRSSDEMYWSGVSWDLELTWLKTSIISKNSNIEKNLFIPPSEKTDTKRQNVLYWSYNTNSINMWTSGETYLVKSMAQDKVNNIENTELEDCFVFDNTPPIVPSTCITAPNGGESLTGGEIFKIKWNNAAINDNYGLEDKPITLYYTPNAGQTWILIANEQPNNGRYNWAVPNVNSKQVKIKITVHDCAGNSSSDESNNIFSITTKE